MKQINHTTVFLIYLIIPLIMAHDCQTNQSTNISNELKIPKVIWTYWHDRNKPELIELSILSWKKWNPMYEIRVVTNENAHLYVGKDMLHLKHASDSFARLSDFIRLNVLAIHGGVWMDASIICYNSLDTLFTSNHEFYGYYLDGFTLPEYSEKSPIIESWFLASVPQSCFVIHWKDEFEKINNYENVNDYIQKLKDLGVNFQRIPYSLQNYLAIHASAQYILQKQHNDFRIKVYKAEDGPYKYITETNWDHHSATKSLVDNVERFKNSILFSKLRSSERNTLLNEYDINSIKKATNFYIKNTEYDNKEYNSVDGVYFASYYSGCVYDRLNEFFKTYPTNYVVLISGDDGINYSYLKRIFPNLIYRHYNNTIIRNFIEKQAIIPFKIMLQLFKNALNLLSSKHVLYIEDDITILQKYNEPFLGQISANHPNDLIGKEWYDFIEVVSGNKLKNIVIHKSGHGGSIYNRDFFQKALRRRKIIYKMLSHWEMVNKNNLYYDEFFTVLTYALGGKVVELYGHREMITHELHKKGYNSVSIIHENNTCYSL